MDSIGEKDCNSKELSRLLVGSIQRLIDMNQWNAFLRVQAVADPFKFIEDVEKFGDEVEKEDEKKGNYHIRLSSISVEGERNKISCIKVIRCLMGWGLADSKYSYEAMSGSGNSLASKSLVIIGRGYSTQQSLQESNEWKEFYNARHLFGWDIARLPPGTQPSDPYRA